MRLLFYHTPNKGELPLVEALMEGARRHGVECESRIIDPYADNPVVDDEEISRADAVFTSRSLLYARAVMEACSRLKTNYVYYDKGYFNRGWKTDVPDVYYRFSVNSFHPLDYFQSVPRPSDRWNKLGIELKKPQKNGRHVIFAGCSWKFARWHDFEITEYATRVISEIKRYTDRPIVYRPKVSSQQPPPIPGTVYSYDERKIHEELQGAHALVTFSSNAAVDAIFAGVPAFVLGPGIARAISNADLSKIETPYFPSEKERLQWCWDIAYCQWRLDEMRSGAVWEYVRETLRSLTHAA